MDWPAFRGNAIPADNLARKIPQAQTVCAEKVPKWQANAKNLA